MPVKGEGGVLERALQHLEDRDRDTVVVVGDTNLNKEADVVDLCGEMKLKDARYAGYSWGVPGNLFFEDMARVGAGLRKDRVLFGRKVWGVSHLVGQGKVFF